MAKASDMSTPVTRGELRKELKRLRSELEKAIAPLATKAELETWAGALLAHIDRGHQQLQIDLARHANALHESMAALIRGHDDKYKDLPPRVGLLEAAVFVRKPS
jgi:hypothetical protein